MPTRYDACLRHAARCASLLQSLEQRYRTGNEAAVAARMEFGERWPQMYGAQAWAAREAARGDAECRRLCDAFATAGGDSASGTSLLEMYRPPDERGRWLEAGVQAARAMHDRGREAAHAYYLGLTLSEASRYETSLMWLSHARELFQMDQNRASEGAACNAMGIVYRVMGQPNEAIRHFTMALGIARDLGDDADVAYALKLLASVDVPGGDRRQAVEHCEEALAIYRRLGDRDGEASALRSLATLALTEHGDGRASRLLEELRLVTELREGSQPDGFYGRKTASLGLAYAAHGDSRAVSLLERELAAFRACGDRTGEAHMLLYLGLAFRATADACRCKDAASAAHDAFSALGNELGMALSLHELGHAHLSLKEIDAALACFRKATELFMHVGYQSGEASAHWGGAQALAASGSYEAAIDAGQQAARIYALVGHSSRVAVGRQVDAWRSLLRCGVPCEPTDTTNP